jgi:uncharacterized membrane protein
MSKERLQAFTDAVLAIIMTILVLELEAPKEMSFSGFWELRASFFSYALSFFWLGSMWVTNHNEWHYVRKIKPNTVWWTIIMLFFASLFPYTTSLVDTHFNNPFAQGLYGIVVLLVSLANVKLSHSLTANDPDNVALAQSGLIGNRSIWLDLAVKLIGLILSVTVFAPAMMLSVLLTLIVFVIPAQVVMARRFN